jgi:hypothetical protein
MAVTVNVYQENALRNLGTYGIRHQDYSTVWKFKTASMFVLLCGTDNAAYVPSFAGTVQELLASGVQELTTANGYVQGGLPAPWAINDPFYGFVAFLRSSASGNSAFYLPRTLIGATRPYSAIKWTVTSNSISAKSALLCFESPVSSASTIYSRSYPLAMIDFGGTRTSAVGTPFEINWSETGAITWTR